MKLSEGEGGAWNLEGAALSASAAPSGRISLFLKGASRDAAFELSEFFGTPDGSLGARLWEASAEPDALTLSTTWESVLIEKRISLTSDGRRLRIDYAFVHTGPILIRPAFGIRIRLAAHPEARWRVPVVGGLRSDRFDGLPERLYLRPAEPWCEAFRGPARLSASFPDGALDAVEVDGSESDGCFTLTPLVYFIGLSPGCEARMPAHFDASPAGAGEGEGREETLRSAYTEPLLSVYGPATPDRRARAEEAVRLATAVPGAGVLKTSRALRERSDRLAAGRPGRLDLIRRAGDGEISVDDAVAALRERAS